MECLNCKREMMNHFVQARGSEMAYDICEGCGSLWLDAGELDKMAFQVDGSIEFSSREADEQAKEKARGCPRCPGERMEKVAFLGHSDILLDRCGNCGGFWLDGGELDSINAELTKIMPTRGAGFSDFVTRVHMPYWTKRIKVRSSDTDFTRDVPVLKGAEPVEETDLTCPVCGARLTRYRIFGILFEGCGRCRGMFLGTEELRKLKDKAGGGQLGSLRWMDDEVEAIDRAAVAVSDRTCPRCTGQRLMTAVFGDTRILIDHCPTCRGTWLDAGELRQIVAALTEKLRRLSSKEAAGKLYQEIKEVWSGPEGKVSEILDAAAALCALLNVAIFEHPTLARVLIGTAESARKAGLG